MVVLFHQYTENICFFSKLSAGGLCDWGILLVIPLEFQGKKHQPFSMTQPFFSRLRTLPCAFPAQGFLS